MSRNIRQGYSLEVLSGKRLLIMKSVSCLESDLLGYCRWVTRMMKSFLYGVFYSTVWSWFNVYQKQVPYELSEENILLL